MRSALVSFDAIIQSHMCFDAQIYDMRFSFQLFSFTAHGFDSPKWDRVFCQALGPHGSRGFLRKGEIACTVTGNWRKVLSEKWKEDCRNSWQCLRSTWKGNYSPDPCRISSNPHLGSAVFPQAKFALRTNGPRRGRLSTTEEHQTLVWYARLWRRATLPREG